MASQAGAPVDDPDRGRRISKYEILTRLSVGGMAELFLAFTSGPGGFRKFVALKQILPDVKTEEFVKMFLDEARITAAFSHANIGQVFDLGEEDGELYLAMEFLAGQNLEQLMKAANKLRRAAAAGLRRPRDSRRVPGPALRAPLRRSHRQARWRSSTATCLPRNVMVTYDGGVKVIDFGIAKAKGRLGRTAVGMVKGTGGYMSPEQVRNRELDGRSDLFSSGVLLYEMLTGRRLFNAVGDAAMMLQIVEGAIPPPRTINPNIPEALEAVVLRALTRELPKRFATGREMAKAIEQAMGQELFDEEGMAALMDELFAEKRQKTRALLEYANRDDARISEAAGALQDDAGESLLGVGVVKGHAQAAHGRGGNLASELHRTGTQARKRSLSVRHAFHAPKPPAEGAVAPGHAGGAAAPVFQGPGGRGGLYHRAVHEAAAVTHGPLRAQAPQHERTLGAPLGPDEDAHGRSRRRRQGEAPGREVGLDGEAHAPGRGGGSGRAALPRARPGHVQAGV